MEVAGIIDTRMKFLELDEELQQSLEDSRATLNKVVEAMVLLCEVRDPYTSGHQRRVAQLACAVAREMGLSEEHNHGICTAGFIHDIGKVAVPMEILSKPSRLSDYEFSIIKTHPEVAYEVLKGLKFPWPVAQAILQHHERLDGSGYPKGLSGEDIILEARSLGVADVVEAMASHRPYRPALGMDRALQEISQNRGILYDPKVVDACLKLCTEKGFKFE